MMTKRATIYETTDEKWHKTRKQADAHQALIDFSKWREKVSDLLTKHAKADAEKEAQEASAHD